MADVKVRNVATGEITEMSEYMFTLLRPDFVLLGDPNPAPRVAKKVAPVEQIDPAIQVVSNEPDNSDLELQQPDEKQEVTPTLEAVRAEYELLTGDKPHHRLGIPAMSEIINKIKEAKAKKGE